MLIYIYLVGNVIKINIYRTRNQINPKTFARQWKSEYCIIIQPGTQICFGP